MYSEFKCSIQIIQTPSSVPLRRIFYVWVRDLQCQRFWYLESIFCHVVKKSELDVFWFFFDVFGIPTNILKLPFEVQLTPLELAVGYIFSNKISI